MLRSLNLVSTLCLAACTLTEKPAATDGLPVWSYADVQLEADADGTVRVSGRLTRNHESEQDETPLYVVHEGEDGEGVYELRTLGGGLAPEEERSFALAFAVLLPLAGGWSGDCVWLQGAEDSDLPTALDLGCVSAMVPDSG